MQNVSYSLILPSSENQLLLRDTRCEVVFDAQKELIEVKFGVLGKADIIPANRLGDH